MASGWTGCVALAGRGQSVVTAAIDQVRAGRPFALCGLDTDNDSAFINDTLLAYCRNNGLELTRCRP